MLPVGSNQHFEETGASTFRTKRWNKRSPKKPLPLSTKIHGVTFYQSVMLKRSHNHKKMWLKLTAFLWCICFNILATSGTRTDHCVKNAAIWLPLTANRLPFLKRFPSLRPDAWDGLCAVQEIRMREQGAQTLCYADHNCRYIHISLHITRVP